MSEFEFEVNNKEKSCNARSGIIHTAHGDIKTPSFVAVGTQASVKSLANHELQEIGTQIFFVNTYHMYLRPGEEVLKKFDGLHNFIGWHGPLITDSAGFQVFSLAREGVAAGTPLVKISDEGVLFRSHLDGSEHFFTPKKSIEMQNLMGADIMIAFDECTTYPASYEYTKSAMERTHRWAVRCLEQSSKCKVQSAKLRKPSQALYGVVQGGIYEDLRKESAKFISGLPFDGIAIGGVAVGEGKANMKKVLEWVMPNIDRSKPCHLLGVGEIDDIFSAVESGVDTFDCVMPTRLGRTGFCLTKFKVQSSKCKDNRKKFLLDLAKAEFAYDENPIDKTCQCFVCKNYSRAYLHHLFRTKELLSYRLFTYHNLWFIERLMDDIRLAISTNSLGKLKKEWLN